MGSCSAEPTEANAPVALGMPEQSEEDERPQPRRQRRRLEAPHGQPSLVPLWLILGDGNLSYSAALVAATPDEAFAHSVVATTLDRATTSLRGVDATALRQTLLPRLCLAAAARSEKGDAEAHSEEEEG
eukprot:CAMPEP_0117468760 /NCGR_PEP_ID=MMETSP0784-20121206/6344_1 /TAXON_ID=39447 /ORGANISM="" /LENGTH=128 /DNA_ID=CAMNT_0005262783 /DNA_START=48 /DNA_END=432 /DNA_ORIENTATION=-